MDTILGGSPGYQNQSQQLGNLPSDILGHQRAVYPGIDMTTFPLTSPLWFKIPDGIEYKAISLTYTPPHFNLLSHPTLSSSADHDPTFLFNAFTFCPNTAQSLCH